MRRKHVGGNSLDIPLYVFLDWTTHEKFPWRRRREKGPRALRLIDRYSKMRESAWDRNPLTSTDP
jgi:hypothetical protein